MLLRVIQERHDLCTGAGILWREGCLCHAAGDAVGNSPHDRFIIPIRYLDIGKWILDSGLFLAVCLPHECHDFTARARLARTKRRCGGAGSDIFGNRPHDGLVIPIRWFHITELVGNRLCHIRTASISPQERDCLRTRTDLIGAERRFGCTRCDALFHCPIDRIVIPSSLWNIGESCRGCLSRLGRRRIACADISGLSDKRNRVPAILERCRLYFRSLFNVPRTVALVFGCARTFKSAVV